MAVCCLHVCESKSKITNFTDKSWSKFIESSRAWVSLSKYEGVEKTVALEAVERWEIMYKLVRWAKLPCLLFSFVCTVKPKSIHTPGKFGVFVSVHFIYLFIFIQVAYKCDRGWKQVLQWVIAFMQFLFRYCPSMPAGENAVIPPIPQNAGYHRECYQRYTCKSKIDRQKVLEEKRKGVYGNGKLNFDGLDSFWIP